jgi:hypothetical protein
MKPTPRLLLLAGLILALTGCQTVDSRIAEKSSAFAALDPAAQAKLKQGVVSIGDTPDLAYIALGAPDEKRIRQTASGTTEIWIYSDYYGYDAGPYFYGYYHCGARGWPYMDPYFPYYGMHYWPHYGGSYGAGREERVRIAFEAGKAVEIEQPNPKS